MELVVENSNPNSFDPVTQNAGPRRNVRTFQLYRPRISFEDMNSMLESIENIHELERNRSLKIKNETTREGSAEDSRYTFV